MSTVVRYFGDKGIIRYDGRTDIRTHNEIFPLYTLV